MNVSSMVAFAPQPFSGLYAASKAAVGALSESLHAELSPFGVRVILVEPGPYPTRLLHNQLIGRNAGPTSPYTDTRRGYEAAVARLALGPAPDPQEVADAICAAVNAPNPRFRHIVGAFAQQLAALRQSSDFEGFNGRSGPGFSRNPEPSRSP